MSQEITVDVAKRVLEVVDAGLCRGMGVPTPGNMCVEAAVCYAMGLPHSDDPECVDPVLRELKIKLNDAHWSSPQARAAGMRRLALAQLGSVNKLPQRLFTMHVFKTTRTVLDRFVEHIWTKLDQCLTNTNTNYHYNTDDDALQLLQRQLRAMERSGYRPGYEYYLGQVRGGLAVLQLKASDARQGAIYEIFKCMDALQAAASEFRKAEARYDKTEYGPSVVTAVNAVRFIAEYMDHLNLDERRGEKILVDFAESIVQVLAYIGVPGLKWLPLTETQTETETSTQTETPSA